MHVKERKSEQLSNICAFLFGDCTRETMPWIIMGNGQLLCLARIIFSCCRLDRQDWYRSSHPGAISFRSCLSVLCLQGAQTSTLTLQSVFQARSETSLVALVDLWSKPRRGARLQTLSTARADAGAHEQGLTLCAALALFLFYGSVCITGSRSVGR